jgi:hypothetical protein
MLPRGFVPAQLIRGRGHAWFRAEASCISFVGFLGFTSKLWLAHDNGTYRGLYEWDGTARAEHYARSLWRVLELGCPESAIHFRVFPGLTRDQVLVWSVLDLFFSHASNGATFTDVDRQHLYPRPVRPLLVARSTWSSLLRRADWSSFVGRGCMTTGRRSPPSWRPALTGRSLSAG